MMKRDTLCEEFRTEYGRDVIVSSIQCDCKCNLCCCFRAIRAAVVNIVCDGIGTSERISEKNCRKQTYNNNIY